MTVEEERRRRIRVSCWAYAYEFDDAPLVDDATYDQEARLIDPKIETGHERLDEFFREHFDPSTGMWVREHPQLAKLRQLVSRLRTLQRKPLDATPAACDNTEQSKHGGRRTMKLDELVGKYVEVRDKKADLTAAYKEKVAKIDAVLDKIESILLQQFELGGMDSVKTPHGTAYKTTKTSYGVADWDAALDFIKAHELWHVLERRVAKAGVESYKEETGELLPGLNARTEVTVNIRRT